jgi:hypothetical protein
MTEQPKNPEIRDGNAEKNQLKPATEASRKNVITTADDNNLQRAGEQQIAQNTRRGTGPYDNPLTLVMDDGTEVQDKRPLGKGYSSANPNEMQTAQVPQPSIVSEKPDITDQRGIAIPARLGGGQAETAIRAEVQAESFGATTQVHNGMIEYHRTVNGNDTALFQEPATDAGLLQATSELEKLVRTKEHELREKYGITFSKPGEVVDHQLSLAGVPGPAMLARWPSLTELDAVEEGLAHSEPAQHAKKGIVKFCFVDRQQHDGPHADTTFKDHPDGTAAIYVYPEAARDAHNNSHTMAEYIVHEMGHNTIHKYAMQEGIISPELTQSISWRELVPPYENTVIRDHAGALWYHPAGASKNHWWVQIQMGAHPPVASPRHWWEAMNVEPLDKNGNPTGTESRFVTAPYSEFALPHRSMVRAQDGSLFSHELTNPDPHRYWVRRDADGHPLDAHGAIVDAAHAEALSNEDMMLRANMRPSSDYFDSSEEVLAEGLTAYRVGGAERRNLLRHSPRLYEAVKGLDDLELKNAYGVGPDGEPNKVRLPSGRVVKNNDDAQRQIREFEHGV